METNQISIPISYNTNVSFSQGQAVGIGGTVVLLIIASIIFIKSFSLDKK